MKQRISWAGVICLAGTILLGSAEAPTAFAHGPLHARMERVAKRIEEAPLDAALYYERALLHREHGDPEIARADLEHSLTLEPNDSTTRCTLASVRLECGEPEAALEDARAVLTALPEHPGARLVEARALVALDQPEAAIAVFDQLIENGPPPSPDLVLERFRTVRSADPTNTRRAVLGLDVGIARVGPLVSLVLPAIEIERATGLTDAALERVALLEQQAGRPTPWLVLEAQILVEAGRLTEARARADEAKSRLESGPRQNSRANLRLAERLATVERSIGESEVRRRIPTETTHSEPRGGTP